MRSFIQKPTQQVKESWSLRAARKLYNTLHTARIIKLTPDLTKWAKELDKIPGDQKDIQYTLDWFCSNLPNAEELGIPLCMGAKGFLINYDKYVRMRRLAPGEVQVEETSSALAKELLNLHWPPGTDIVLPLLIDTSIKNYTVFREGFRPFLDYLLDAHPGSIITRLGLHLQSRGFLAPPIIFVRAWCLDLLRVIGFPEYRGDLLKHCFEETSPRFHNLGRTYAYQWSHASKLWDDLYKEYRKWMNPKTKANEKPETS